MPRLLQVRVYSLASAMQQPDEPRWRQPVRVHRMASKLSSLAWNPHQPGVATGGPGGLAEWVTPPLSARLPGWLRHLPAWVAVGSCLPAWLWAAARASLGGGGVEGWGWRAGGGGGGRGGRGSVAYFVVRTRGWVPRTTLGWRSLPCPALPTACPDQL